MFAKSAQSQYYIRLMDREKTMKLTLKNRFKLCWEILTTKSGHAHTAQEKQLSVFHHGYAAGRLDTELYISDVNRGGFCKECDGLTVTTCVNCGAKY